MGITTDMVKPHPAIHMQMLDAERWRTDMLSRKLEEIRTERMVEIEMLKTVAATNKMLRAAIAQQEEEIRRLRSKLAKKRRKSKN